MPGPSSLLKKPQYQEIFEKGTQAGFYILMANQYFGANASTGQIDPQRPQLEQTMTTPYTFRDQPVIGYTVTDLSSKNSPVRGESLRPTVTHEFYVMPEGREEPMNVDAIIESGEKFTDKNTGKSVSIPDAMKEMGEFASAASEYPHVFTPDEYMEARSYMNGRLGLPMPTADDYVDYLNNMSAQLEQRIPIVGAVTKPADMVRFREVVGFPEDLVEKGATTPGNDYGD